MIVNYQFVYYKYKKHFSRTHDFLMSHWKMFHLSQKIQNENEIKIFAINKGKVFKPGLVLHNYTASMVEHHILICYVAEHDMGIRGRQS